MGLQPLEFSDCYTDSPWFRQSIQEHEESLSRTNNDIKGLVKESKNLLSASIDYGKKLESFSKRLKEFTFSSIGENMTDREKNLTSSLKEYGHIFDEIASVWQTNIEETKKHFYEPLEEFRKTQLQAYKEQKKKFDKSSEQYYKLLQNTLSLSHKKKVELLQEQDKELFFTKSNFHGQALDYVFMLQEIQEKKKFEFVEIFTQLMKTYFKCYHEGQRLAVEQDGYISRTEEQLEAAKAETEDARNKADTLMRRMKTNPADVQFMNGRWSRCGYLYITNNHSGVRLTSKWSRLFCTYNKESKLFQHAQPFQTSSSSVLPTGRTQNSSSAASVQMDTCMVIRCVGRNTDTIDKRFCFDLEVEELADGSIRTMTCQAISDDDRRQWMNVMDGIVPEHSRETKDTKRDEGEMGIQFQFDEMGFKLLDNIIGEIERRGVDSEGIYRISGVMSRVEQLISQSINPATTNSVDFSNEDEVDFTTLTSSLKLCFRGMEEPVCTYRIHNGFIEASKHPDPKIRFEKIMRCVRQLPEANRRALKVLTHHLYKVTQHQDVNRMGFSNLGVVFGPTLLRQKQETMSSIMEIKFCNATVEIFIERYEELFYDGDGTPKKQQKATNFVRLPSQRVKRRGQLLQGNWETLSQWGSLTENAEDLNNSTTRNSSTPVSTGGSGDLICLDSQEDLANLPSTFQQPRFQRSKAFRSHDKPVVHRVPPGTSGARDKDSDDFSASPCTTDNEDHDPFQLPPLDIDSPPTTNTESNGNNGGIHRYHSSLKFQRQRAGGVRAPSSARIVDASKRQFKNLVRKASAGSGGGASKTESPDSNNSSSNNNNHPLKGNKLKTRVMGGSVMMRKSKLGLISGTKTSTASSFHGGTNRSAPLRPRTSPVVTQRPPSGQHIGNNDLPSRSGRAAFGYTAQNENELSFVAGQSMLDLRTTESSNWVTATVRGKTGRVPRQLIEFK